MIRSLFGWVLAVWLAFGSPASAQIGSIAGATQGEPAHAWAVIERDGVPLLVHVQPRDGGGRFVPAEPGSVRPVRTLKSSPESMVGVGDRLYLFFPPSGTSSGPIRRVLSLRSVPAAISGLWTDVPHGLLDSMPALPASGRLIATAADGEGRVYALARAPGAIEIWSLDDDEWELVALPDGIGGAEPLAVSMLSFGDGVFLAMRTDAGSRAWARDVEGTWGETMLADWDRFWDATWRQGFGREVLVAEPPTDGRQEIWSLSAARSSRVGSVRSVPGSAFVLLPSAGRLVAVRPGTPGIEIEELSAVTGRSLFDGPSPTSVPVPRNEFRLVVLMVLLIMSGALFVIIRPGAERAWTVPDGWSLADPGRRLLATFGDVLLVAMAISPVFGVTVRQILTLEVLILGGHAWLAIPTLAIAGWISMSVWEALLGATPGKFLMGCRVARAQAGPGRRVTLFWCLVRNGVKWLVCPAAMLALIDPQGRHRGDAAARAVVVTRAPPEPEP